MNPDWLDDFLALAASGNFSRAAEARHMTQPAFSRRVRALEEWLGASLVDRSTQPASLTEAGRWFRDVAQDLLSRMARLPEAAQAVASNASATLRFAATHALSLTFLPAWLRGLEAASPLGPMQLVSDIATQCETLMQQGRAQFMLAHAHAAVPGRLDQPGWRALAVGADAIVAASAPDAAGHPHRVFHGERLAVLDYSEGSGLGRLVQALRGPGPATETVFTAHLATVLRSMALQGRGVAWLPRSLIEDDLRAGRLVQADDIGPPLRVEIRLYRRDAPESPAAEAFWRLLEAAAAAPGGPLSAGPA